MLPELCIACWETPRNAHTNDLSTLIRLYKANVLPVLKYCSSVWNPVMKKDITKLEKVQRTFTRILFYRAFPSKQYPRLLPDYKTKLEVLGLKSLSYRRVLADLMMSFKIIKNEIKLKPSYFWVFSPTSSRRFSINLTVPRYRGWRSRVHHQSFAWRSRHLLNHLPESLLTLKSSKKIEELIAQP